jgi:hypothetical protein
LGRNGYVPQMEQIVHGVSEVLFAPEVAFRCLHRRMAQQKLNLLDLATIGVAKLRAGPAQVMRRDVL